MLPITHKIAVLTLSPKYFHFTAIFFKKNYEEILNKQIWNAALTVFAFIGDERRESKHEAPRTEKQ